MRGGSKILVALVKAIVILLGHLLTGNLNLALYASFDVILYGEQNPDHYADNKAIL
jgi:hypothetical protein